jgi:hypothetical protein
MTGFCSVTQPLHSPTGIYLLLLVLVAAGTTARSFTRPGHGHPQTNTAYAWLHDTGDPANPLPVTVLHIDPALSPAKAVRAFIVQEYDNA